MVIRMLVAERVAANGREVRWHKEGEILDLPQPLAESMIRARLATSEIEPKPENEEELPLAHTPKAQVKLSRKREYRQQ